MAGEPTPTADDIQRQMREVRVELRDDVKDLMANAHDMADLSIYVRAYPWLCAGAALAAGYLIVPQRAVVVRPDAEALVELARKHKLVVRSKDEEGPPQNKRGGLINNLLAMAAAAVLQGGMKIATAQLSQAFSAPPNPAHSNGNGRAGGVTS